MKWILIVALACASWYTVYEFTFKGREGAFGGRFARFPAKQAGIASTAAAAPGEDRPLTADEVLAGYGGGASDREDGAGGGAASGTPRSNLPGYVKDKVNSAMQQSERRASGNGRY